jgi:hypothetical protein
MVDLLFSALPRVAVFLLDDTDELIFLTSYPLDIDVGQLVPPGLELLS